MAKPPDHLSPSGWSSFEQCPKKWAERYVYGRDEPASAAMEIGTFVHAVLEAVMLRSASYRTLIGAREMARKLWYATPTESIDRGEITEVEFKRAAWRGITGLWPLGDPAEVDVVATEQRVEWKVGTVPMVAIVDLVERRHDGLGDGLVVSDYKTGKLPKPKFRTSHKRQITIGAMAVAETIGPPADQGAVLYVGVEDPVAVGAPTDLRARRAVHEAAQGVWEDIGRACADEVFPAKASALCSWCTLAAECDEGYARVRLALESGWVTGDEPGAKLVAVAEANRAA